MEKETPGRKAKWPVKAYNNRTFLNCSEARSIRVQCELMEPKHRLQENAVHNTIVFFGSARIQSEAAARAHLEELERKGRAAETPEEGAWIGEMPSRDVRLLRVRSSFGEETYGVVNED